MEVSMKIQLDNFHYEIITRLIAWTTHKVSLVFCLFGKRIQINIKTKIEMWPKKLKCVKLKY